MNKICAILMAALAALVLMTGCTAGKEPPPEEEYHGVICMGSHVNAPVVNLALVEDEIYRPAAAAAA